MRFHLHPLSAAVLMTVSAAAQAQSSPTPATEPTTLEAAVAQATRSATPAVSVPTDAPAVVESTDAEQIARTINATDSSDALKYLPSLQVRKRYVGDFDHAILATRTSGTGTSARSLTYADGLILSNLLGNANNYTPRWGVVTPEEIARVDVLYGPFSALYSGNSVGAVVGYVTRMPDAFEAHVKAQTYMQNFKLYGTDESYDGQQYSASLGSRVDQWSWWISAAHQDNTSQPIAFVVKPLSTTNATAADTVVTGAVADTAVDGTARYVLGATNTIHTVQDNLKVKLAYDLTPQWRVSYTGAVWQNDVERSVDSYLRDAAGNIVTSGQNTRNLNIAGKRYTLLSTDFAQSTQDQLHWMHGLAFKSDTRGRFDWEGVFSYYDYSKDLQRQIVPTASNANAGRITDNNNTGWRALDLRGIWRPTGESGAHVVSFGVHTDHYQLRTKVNDTSDWANGSAGALFSAFTGSTETDALYLQDAWKFAPRWQATLGARYERWQAFDGTLANATTTQAFGERKENWLSPKLAVSYDTGAAWLLRASAGRAYRAPTVAELYQGSISAGQIVNNDPNLKPENALSADLTAEKDLANGLLRISVFREDMKDALYSQTDVNTNITNIQNIDRILSLGAELAYQGRDLLLRGLDFAGSLTWVDSEVKKNDKNPSSVGKKQVRVPEWRATAVVSYRQNEALSYSLGARYSGEQYSNVNNTDVNPETYFGTSKLFMVDVRARYAFAKGWAVAFGIDNLNNDKAWAFHPYAQRTYHLELKGDF